MYLYLVQLTYLLEADRPSILKTCCQPDTLHDCKAAVFIVTNISTLQHMEPHDPVSSEGECGVLGIGQITCVLSVPNAKSYTFSLSLQTQHRHHDILPVYRVLVAEVRKCG